MSENTFSEKIEDYLNGLLSPKEATAFEHTMQNDPALASKVQLERALQMLEQERMKARMHQRYAKMLAEGHPPIFGEPPKTVQGIWAAYRRPLLAAAAVLLVIVAAIRFYPQPDEKLERPSEPAQLPINPTPAPPPNETAGNAPTAEKKEESKTRKPPAASPAAPAVALFLEEREDFKRKAVDNFLRFHSSGGDTETSESDPVVLAKWLSQPNGTNTKQIREIVARLKRVDSSNPQIIEILKLLTCYYQSEGETASAIKVYQKLLDSRYVGDDPYLLVLYLEDPKTYQEEAQALVDKIWASEVTQNVKWLEANRLGLQKVGIMVPPLKK